MRSSILNVFKGHTFYLFVNRLTRFFVCQVLEQALVQGNNPSTSVCLTGNIPYQPPELSWLGHFQPWLYFRISGIDLTGLRRCLHLSFLLCCLVGVTSFQRKIARGKEGTFAIGRTLWPLGLQVSPCFVFVLLLWVFNSPGNSDRQPGLSISGVSQTQTS